MKMKHIIITCTSLIMALGCCLQAQASMKKWCNPEIYSNTDENTETCYLQSSDNTSSVSITGNTTNVLKHYQKISCHIKSPLYKVPKTYTCCKKIENDEDMYVWLDESCPTT